MVYLQRKYVGWSITIFALAFLIYVHIQRMVTDYGGWHIGIETSVMIQTIHLSSVAWDYTDGGENEAKLSSEQKKNAIKEQPTFLEFCASALCPTQSFAGPSSNFGDFKAFIYQTGVYKNVPSTIIPCLKRFGLGVIFVALYVLLHKNFPPEFLRGPIFAQTNFFFRVHPIC